MLKIFRVYAFSQPFSGKPAFGIAIAGGSGNGLVSGLLPLYHFFRIMWMKAIEPLPVTKFDLDIAGRKAEESGSRIAAMAAGPQKFKTRDDRDFWFDSLPNLGNNHSEERRLLAAVTSEAVPENLKKEIAGALARADILEASGKTLESMNEISKVYDSCLEILNRE